MICLDRDGPAIAQCPAHAPASAATAESLAYVMYTSGSTGQPKGVCVPTAASCGWCKTPTISLGAERACCCRPPPLSFDAATFEIWGALLNGAQTGAHAARAAQPGGTRRGDSAAGDHDAVADRQPVQLMIDEHPDGLRGVQPAGGGGEALSVAAHPRALEQLPACQLINGYGPTENTTFSCCYGIEKRDYAVSIPIGAADRQHHSLPAG